MTECVSIVMKKKGKKGVDKRYSMLVTRPWGVLSEAVDKKTCNKIIRLGRNKFKPAGTLENPNDSPKFNTDFRMSDVAWFNDEQWLIDLPAY